MESVSDKSTSLRIACSVLSAVSRKQEAGSEQFFTILFRRRPKIRLDSAFSSLSFYESANYNDKTSAFWQISASDTVKLLISAWFGCFRTKLSTRSMIRDLKVASSRAVALRSLA